MNKTIIHLAALIAIGGLSLTLVHAQAKKSTNTSGLASADQSFVKEAAQGGLAEVELGKLPEQKASDPEVKEFGRKMVSDHSSANDDLKKTADKVGMTLPETLAAKDDAEKTKLSRLSGTDFDKAYMREMVKDHETDVAAFEREASGGSNENVKAFATNTLPKLKEHLSLAQGTNKKVAGSAS